jgi:hypothetical protein
MLKGLVMSDIKSDAKDFVKDLIVGSLETILPKTMVKAIEEGEKLVEDIVDSASKDDELSQKDTEKMINDVNNDEAVEVGKK